MTFQLVPLVAFSAPAVPGSVPLVRGRLVAFAAEHGAGRALLAALGAAVSEAAANAVVHAFRERDAPGPIHVEADVEDGDLEIVIADEGDGFRAGPAPGIGAGLSIVARSADGYAIRERVAGGVELWMRFRLAA